MKLEEGMELLEKGVKNILDNNEVKEMLKVATMFHNYSFNNILMIYCQRRQATKVAGMATWNKLGRWVKKGEKGIAIFAPIFSKSTKKKDNKGEAEYDEAEPADIKRIVGFTIRYVYDIEQTQGKELPKSEILSCNPKGIRLTTDRSAVDLFEIIMAASPVPVTISGIETNGYYDPAKKEIVLNKGLSDLEKPMVLLHEIAHHLAIEANLHAKNKGSYPEAEVIAETAAFVAGYYLGMDTSSYAFPYVAGWGKDLDMILAWGKSALQVAKQIINIVESASEKEALKLAA